MKILQLIDSLAAGGAERMAVNMANAFTASRIANAICVTRAGGPMQSFLKDVVPVYNLGKKNAADTKAFKKLLKIISEFQPNILHAHSSSFFWAVLVKLVYKKMIIVWHDHYGRSETLTPSSRPFVRMLARYFNGIVAVNEILKKWNVANTGLWASRVICINNFPDFSPSLSKSKKTSDINIVCLANFKPEKDHPTLMRAFDKVVKQFPLQKIHLWLVGKSLEKNYYANIVELVDTLNLNDNVVFWGEVREVTELLSQAQIGVLSSSSEGLPLSLLEYGVAEIPVVVTDVGQCKDVVQNGKCGWLVPPRDYQRFAECLAFIIQHPVEAVEKAQLLRQRLISNYGATQFVETYFSFVNRLTKKKTVNEPVSLLV